DGAGLDPFGAVVFGAAVERSCDRPGRARRRVLGAYRRVWRRHPLLSSAAAAPRRAAAAAAHPDLGDAAAKRPGRAAHILPRQRPRCRVALGPPRRPMELSPLV